MSNFTCRRKQIPTMGLFKKLFDGVPLKLVCVIKTAYRDRFVDSPTGPLVLNVVFQRKDVHITPGWGRRPTHPQVSSTQGKLDIDWRIWFHCKNTQNSELFEANFSLSASGLFVSHMSSNMKLDR